MPPSFPARRSSDLGGTPVSGGSLWDGDEEARFVGDEIETLQRQGQGLGGIAILVRAGFQTRAFEERFVTLGVPYRVVGGLRFYERQEVRDALDYLRTLVQPDDTLAPQRIVPLPPPPNGTRTNKRSAAGGEARGNHCTIRMIPV